MVVYDSKHGNMEKVARAIGQAFHCQVHHEADVNPADLKTLNQDNCRIINP
jgi:flavodoxin